MEFKRVEELACPELSLDGGLTVNDLLTSQLLNKHDPVSDCKPSPIHA